MPLLIKHTREKVKCVYKTIYLSQKLAGELHQIAAAHNTSFNNVVVSILEDCLKQELCAPTNGEKKHDGRTDDR